VVLRRSQPTRTRPFLMACYPLPPLLVAVLAACLVASSLAASPLYCACALGFVAMGLPVFECCAKQQPPLPPPQQHHPFQPHAQPAPGTAPPALAKADARGYSAAAGGWSATLDADREIN
jgi:hypothetical protein